MASSIVNGTESFALLRGASVTPRGVSVTPRGLGFVGSKSFPKLNLVNRIPRRTMAPIFPKCSLSSSASSSRPASQLRFIQHKQEAFWFYRFLSIVYDHVINPGHWTEDMRDDALEPADLSDRRMLVVDVGGGTGFTTLGIVKHVDAKNVTILDQSPHQLAKAKEKEPLKDFYPTFWLSRFFADAWMLFPKEEEYIEWFTKAGFKDVQLKRIGPKWYRGVRRHGLIMGCSVTGVKPASGDSPLELGPKAEDVSKPVKPFVFLTRLILGAMAATYYVLVPIYMWIKNLIVPEGMPI
ncbi:2-methyl-6-phytyl-1,4-hydroquinone methyltransferase, chloroplastic [Linum perenne]